MHIYDPIQTIEEISVINFDKFMKVKMSLILDETAVIELFYNTFFVEPYWYSSYNLNHNYSKWPDIVISEEFAVQICGLKIFFSDSLVL